MGNTQMEGKRMGKRELMDELEASSREIHTQVCDPDTNLVWGEGDVDSQLVLVGEAPGEQEDKRIHPFVGAAGEILTSELAMAGLPREHVYVTNVVKCRPTTLDRGRRANRPPTTTESSAWRDALLRELEIISPRVILCLGAVAASALIHPDFKMKAERGKWFDGPLGTKIMATYHPAYLLRARQYGNREALLQFRTDLTEVTKELQRLGKGDAAI